MPNDDIDFHDVVSFHNGEQFTWIIAQSDPVAFAFPYPSRLRGWSVLSPTLVPKDLEPVPEVFPLKEDRFLVVTQYITCSAGANGEVTAVEGERILNWLRLVSGQVQLGTPISGSVKSAGVTRKDQHIATFESRLFGDVEAFGITFELLRSAAQSHPACEVPTYAEILQDALQAQSIADVRKAVLYSAIAVEEMAATRLEEGFSLESAKAPNRFRMVERRTPSGVVRKDPIFEHLRNAGKRDFRLLLDSVPLYVLGRSMCDDQPALYAELRRLREARNGLAHGSGRDSEASLPLTNDGARRAVQAAIDAFAWYGAAGRYLFKAPTYVRARRFDDRRLLENRR
jgi:hypothetical protein